MDLDFFDNTIHHDWDMKEVDRSIDHYKYNEYLSYWEGTDKEFIKQVIRNTTYIPYETFKSKLIENLNIAIDKIGQKPVYILLDKVKIGSEHWIFCIVWPILRKLNIKGFLNYESVDECNEIDVILLDDCIYTGIHMINLIDEFMYNTKIKNKINFHIIVPYSCESAFQLIEEFQKSAFQVIDEFQKSAKCNIIVHTLYKLKCLKNLIDLKECPIPKIFKKLFNTIYQPLIYFDHKVAGICSTYPQIYLQGILPNLNDEGELLELGKNEKFKKFGTILKQKPSREKIIQFWNLYFGDLREFENNEFKNDEEFENCVKDFVETFLEKGDKLYDCDKLYNLEDSGKICVPLETENLNTNFGEMQLCKNFNDQTPMNIENKPTNLVIDIKKLRNIIIYKS